MVAVFLKLGVIGFGGPAAHLGLIEEEVVRKRRWLDRDHLLDLVGLTNLIPGPNSTELCIHLGYLRAGWRGLLAAGFCFLLPAVALSLLAAWVYAAYGTLPVVESFTRGIKPAVLAVIVAAGWRLGRTAVRGPVHAVFGAGLSIAVLFGLGEVVAVLAGALVGTLLLGLPRRGEARCGGVELIPLALVFLKVGSVLYGSGYVLIAFLEGDLVEGFGWLTRAQLLDAVAVGQFTPGPILSTSTFIGFQLAGVSGALLCTAAIFLPSFVFVALLAPLVARLRASAWANSFLQAVRVSAVALLAAVVVKLAFGTLGAPFPIAVFAIAAVAGVGFRVGAAWLVLGGGAVGILWG